MRALLVCASLLVAACSSTRHAPSSSPRPPACPPVNPSPSDVTLTEVALIEPDGEWAHMLSGLWYDPQRGVFLSVRDNDARVAWMRPDPTWQRWTGGLDEVSLSPHTQIEGLTGTPAGLVFSDEDPADASPPGPHVFRLADGGAGALVAVPSHFQRAQNNSGFEALSATPDGSRLIVGVERSLGGDPAGVLRFLVIDTADGGQREYAYRLGPSSWSDGDADLGVSDLVALSPTRLLTLERAYRRDRGNSVRIFLVDLSGAPDVLGQDTLPVDVAVASKRLVLDVATLPRESSIAPAATQTHPAMGNYEGMALGPCLPDGRRSLVLVTDDNDDWVQLRHMPPQARRILVLGARGL